VRDRLREHLRAARIGTGVHYPAPVHLQPAYRKIAVSPSGLAETERCGREILSLPMYPQLENAAIERVAAAMRQYFSSH
jgi:dTDP-4-amino-4,6-dideoxygalactose transaminase